VARAVHAGADPDAVKIVEVEQVPLTYLLDPAVRIRVKAAGRLALDRHLPLVRSARIPLRPHA
jgi:hypothetical protein